MSVVRLDLAWPTAVRVALATIVAALGEPRKNLDGGDHTLNKYKLFKQIRGELAESCSKELRAVEEILQRGLTIVAGGMATIEINTPNSLNSMSESGRIFRDELAQTTRLILERYQRNLKKEMAALGLQDHNSHPETGAMRLSAETNQRDSVQLDTSSSIASLEASVSGHDPTVV